MPDGDSSKNLSNELTNAIVKPVVSEIGQMAKEVGQSFGLTPTQLDPQRKILEKKEEERKKQNIVQFINEQIARDKASLQRQHLETKQEEQKEMVQEHQTKNLQQVKKEERFNAIKAAQARVEIKRGIGG